MMRCFLIILIFFACSARAATWYVDGAATGANTGIDWADAWTNPTNAYDSADGGPVAPGDTVWIKGYDYVNTHGASAWVLGYGTASSRTHYYFTNGVSTIYCAIELVRYTDLIGGNPASLSVISKDIRTVYQVTNTWLLHSDRHTNLFGIGSGGRNIIVAGNGNVIQQLQITGSRDTVVNSVKSDSASTVYYDLSLKGDSSTSNLLQYCWINQSSGWGAGAAITLADMGNGPTRTFASGVEVCYSLLETNGSDVFNHPGYCDFHHNIIRTRAGLGAQGCNDTFTIGGAPYDRIHHNMIEPADNSLYYLWGGTGDIHDFYFYDNLLTPVISAELDTSQTPPFALIEQQGSGIQEQDVFTGPMYYIRSNVVFACNTDALTTNMGPNSMVGFLTKNAAATGNTNGFTVTPNSYYIENNLVVEWDTTPLNGSAVGAFGFYPGNLSQYGTNDAGEGWYYNSNSIIFDFNQAYSYYPGNTFLCEWGSSYTNWAGIFLTNSADVVRVIGYTHNSTAPVAFKNPVANSFAANFQPITTAQGTNLSGIANMPDIGIDLYGQPRSTWMGAIEPDNSLVLWLTFARDDGWTTNHVITDRSGFGNHAYYMPSTNHQTWPTYVVGPGGLPAAKFVMNYTNSGQFQQGTYAAITNVGYGGPIDSFTNGTWACWFADDVPVTAPGSSDDGLFLSTAQEVDGVNNPNKYASWRMGKYYDANPEFWRPTYDPINLYTEGGQFYASYPPTEDHDSSWHHYAVTWDGNNWQPYLDGQVWNNSTSQTNNNNYGKITNQWTGQLISTNSTGGVWSWIGVGVNTHGNLPYADAANGPNNGQLWGRLSDIRIYSRPLSSTEVHALYIAGGGGDLATNAPVTSTRGTSILGISH